MRGKACADLLLSTKVISYSAIQLLSFDKEPLYFLNALSGLTGALTGYDAIVQIFPKLTMLFQVNLNGDFMTFIIRDKLKASHDNS